MKNNLITYLQKRESKRINQLSNLEYPLTYENYLSIQKIFSDDYLYYSSYEFFNHNKVNYFYTPDWVLFLMIDKTVCHWLEKNDSIENIKILNPYCGSGSLTQIIIEYLLIQFKKLYPHTDNNILLEKIITENVFSWDTRSEAVEICHIRIKNIFNIESYNIEHKNFLLETQKFDIVIGVPPTGDLLHEDIKNLINSTNDNVFLDFINHGLSNIGENGEICFLIPHNFSYLEKFNLVRKNLYQTQSIHKVIDLEVNFQDIYYEAIVLCLNHHNNLMVDTSSFKELKYNQKVPYHLFFNTNFFYKFILYWNYEYQLLQDSFPELPFKNIPINKKELSQLSIKDFIFKYLTDDLLLSEKYENYLIKYIFNNSTHITLKKEILSELPIFR